MRKYRADTAYERYKKKERNYPIRKIKIIRVKMNLKKILMITLKLIKTKKKVKQLTPVIYGGYY